MNQMIMTIEIPDDVKKTKVHRHFDILEVYDNKLVGKTNGKNDVVWYYADLTDIQVVHANISNQFAQLVLMNASNPNANRLRDQVLVPFENNRVMFSCGVLPKPGRLNPFVDELLAKIRPVFQQFKDGLGNANAQACETPNVQPVNNDAIAMVTVFCPKCGTKHGVPANLKQAQITCVACQNVFTTMIQ